MREVRKVREVLGVLGVLGVLVLQVLGAQVLGAQVLGAQVLGAQVLGAQVRDVRPDARGTAVIAGVVVADDTEGRPVRKARVTCGAPDVPGHTAITDENGRFAFRDLPAGRYAVSAAKATWINTNYGAKRPGRAGAAIPLADGQRIDIVLRMPRGAVIEGVLLNHLNEPAAAAVVQAMRWTNVDGARRLVNAANAATDDRGAYRIFGLAPGDYAVFAVGTGTGDAELRLPSEADVRHAAENLRTPPPSPRTVSVARTYFPGSTTASDAAVITLRAGEERTGVDFRLQVVPTARVEGTVLSPGGSVPPGTEVHLSSLAFGPAVTGLRTVTATADGAFSFPNVAPGQYTLIARARQPIVGPDGSAASPQFLWASSQIAVEGEPLTGVSLSLEPALTISGQVRFDSASLKPPDPKSLRIMAQPVVERSLISFAPPAVNLDANGRFTIPNVTPGPCRFAASLPDSGRPGAWRVKSVIANGQEALDQPFIVQPGQHVLDAVVTFTDRLAEVSGAVHAPPDSGADYTVILFPEDQRLWVPQSRRIQAVRPGADGVYVIRNLPAGNYLVALADDVENGEWFDTAFLQRLLASAERVVVRDAERVTHDLRAAR